MTVERIDFSHLPTGSSTARAIILLKNSKRSSSATSWASPTRKNTLANSHCSSSQKRQNKGGNDDNT